MTIRRLIAVAFIFVFTAAGWFVLGTSLTDRTRSADRRLAPEVAGNWGAPMTQTHPAVFHLAPTVSGLRRPMDPVRSAIDVDLRYDPKRKGLLWYRTYHVLFRGEYLIRNPTPIAQTMYVRFDLPADGLRYDQFELRLGGEETLKAPTDGALTASIDLEPGGEAPVTVSYRAAGLNHWTYSFASAPRLRDFTLTLRANFKAINIPSGTESPTSRVETEEGWDLTWQYADVIGARGAGMDMPAVVNPGPAAARMAFFAPVSLLFYFSVLIILGMARGVALHPINYFFLAAGCFSFQLMFAYMVDLVPTIAAFSIAAGVSVTLVTAYLWRAAGGRFARLSAAAQLAYMVLFSCSFFHPGSTGITITAGSVLTLAILMAATARVDWTRAFSTRGAAG